MANSGIGQEYGFRRAYQKPGNMGVSQNLGEPEAWLYGIPLVPGELIGDVGAE